MILGHLLASIPPKVGTIGMGDNFWLPIQGSKMSQDVDMAWNWVMWISIAFFFLLMVPMVYFCFKYKRKSDDEPTSPVEHSTTLEIAWSVLPLIIVIGLFFVGLKGFLNAVVTPSDSYEIRVQAQKWSWTFIYPDGTVSGELYLPKDRKVRLVFSSTDVVHSFFVPAFRVKQDVVPSLYTTLWVQPDHVMDTVLECTQYCGKGHSEMLAHVKVVEQAEFDSWLEAQNKVEITAEGGKVQFQKFNCATCHGANGEGGQGPKLIGLFGTQVDTDKGTVTADENYLRESIMASQAKIVKGYPAGLMPVFQGTMKEKQVDAIIAYIKSLK